MKTAIAILLLGAWSAGAFGQTSPWSGRLEIDRWGIEEGLPQHTVHAIAETPDGSLWLATSGGLVRFDGLAFEVFDVANTPALATNRVRSLLADRHGALWAGTVAGGVTRYQGGRFAHFPIGDDTPGELVHWLVEDAEGVLWARSRAVARFDGTRFEPVPEAKVEPLLAGRARVIYERRTVWISSRPGAPLPHQEFLQDLEQTLDDLVYAIHLDRNGQLWCGTRLRGLVRLRPAAWKSLEIGHPHRGCRLVPDGEGGIWIGPHRDRGLFHSVGGKIVERVLGDPEIPMVCTLGMVAARDGTVWARHGRFATAMRGEHFVVHDLGRVGLGTSPMVEDKGGAIWCGMDGGLCHIREGKVRWFGPEEGLDSTARISGLGATRDGEVWVGSLGLIHRWDGQRFQRFDAADGVPRGFIRTFCEASDGSLWVGSYGGGLARFTGVGFALYGARDGLPDNAISAILEDERGNLWMNCNHGAFSVRLAALRDHVPGVSPELPIRMIHSGEGNGIQGCLAGEKVVFPTTRGLVAIDMERALASPATPPVARITSFDLSEDRDLEVRYTAPDLLDPGGLRFRHRLVGYHPRWIRAGTRREAFYTQLPPGDYTFEVVAIDSSGQGSEPASLSISIFPRFHETTWFAILVGLAVLGSAFGVYRWRLRGIRARNARLQEEVEERRRAEEALLGTQEVLRVLSRKLIVARDEERRGIARELHDDVTQRLAALSIQAEVLEDRLGSISEADRQQAHDLARTAMGVASDIQHLSRRLHPASLTELGLVRAMRSECDAFSKREGIAVSFDAGGVADEFASEVTLSAFRILQESLHNVEKHARATEVEVGLYSVDGELRLDVRDTGRGFDPDRVDAAGIGLVTMRERALSIGGRLEVESTPGQGTTVHLRVPLRSSE